MSKYTIVEDEIADLTIQKELDFLVREIIKKYGNYINCILLGGGFGRGEGAVVKEKDHYRPINDYDLLLLYSNPIPAEVLRDFQSFEEYLNKNISVKQVDLSIINSKKLSIPYMSVARYEMKNGHILLYGKCKNTIRSFPASLIPLFEGTTYFRNRSAGLIIAKLLLEGYGFFDKKKRVELIQIEIIKAYLVLGDSFLIAKKKYHYSYVKRKKIIIKYKNEISSLILEKYIAAIDQKLKPDFTNLSLEELYVEWYNITKLIISSFLEYESSRYKKKFKSVNKYISFLDTLVQKKNMITFIKQKFNKEANFEILQLRKEIFVLLNNSFNTGNPEDYTNWNKDALNLLLDWHPNGIISELKKNKL